MRPPRTSTSKMEPKCYLLHGAFRTARRALNLTFCTELGGGLVLTYKSIAAPASAERSQ
jgi:hypothetical protein